MATGHRATVNRFTSRIWLERYAAWIVLASLLVIAILLSPVFHRPVFLLNLVKQASPIGVAAIGLTFVMLIRGVDLSIGATMSLVAVLAGGWMSGSDANIAPVVLGCLTVGALIGAVHGLLLLRPGLPPFILTMGTATSLIGLNLLYTGGTTRGDVAPGFREVMNGRIGSIPIMALLLLLAVVVALYLQKRTLYGRYLYLIGANPQAARLSGLPVRTITVATYAIGGLMAAAGGLMLVGRSGVSGTLMAQFAEFDAIAAVMLGGTTFDGGRGGVAGTLAGILVLQVAFGLVNVVGLSYFAQLLAKGVIIAGAAGLYAYLRRD